MRQFAKDYLLSLLLGGFLILVGWGTLSIFLAGSLKWIVIFFPVFALLPLAGPIVLSIYGLRRRRWGLPLGPITLLVLAYILAGVWMRNDVREVELADQRGFDSFQDRPNTLIIDHYSGRCDTTCLEIMATSEFQIAIWNNSVGKWTIHQRLEGDACSDAAYRASTIDFIEAGFAGLCASTSLQSDVTDAVIIRYRHDRGYKDNGTSGILPGTFSGLAYELIEQHGDSQRLLGRWVTGSIEPRIAWLALLGATPMQIKVGAQFAEREFYSAALGLDLSGGRSSGNRDLVFLLDAIEPYIGVSGRPTKTLSVFRKLAERAASEKPEILPARIERLLGSGNEQATHAGLEALSALRGIGVEFVQPSVKRLLESGDATAYQAGVAALESLQGSDLRFAEEPVEALLRRGDPQANIAGLKAIKAMQGTRLDFARGPIATMLQSKDPQTVAAALSALSAFRVRDRNFADKHLFELALSPMVRDIRAQIVNPLVNHLRGVSSIPPELRLRAKDVLLHEAELSRGQSLILLTVMTHGVAVSRQEVIDLIFSLSGRNFAETVIAIGDYGWRNIGMGTEKDWTIGEIAILIDRADEVPNDLLESYSEVFRFRTDFDRLESQLLDVVEQRLDEAEAAEHRNEEEIKRLKRLIYAIPRNST